MRTLMLCIMWFTWISMINCAAIWDIPYTIAQWVLSIVSAILITDMK